MRLVRASLRFATLDYSTATVVPYVAGPNQIADATSPRNAQL